MGGWIIVAGATHILIGQILIIDEIYRCAHRLSKRVRHNQIQCVRAARVGEGMISIAFFGSFPKSENKNQFNSLTRWTRCNLCVGVNLTAHNNNNRQLPANSCHSIFHWKCWNYCAIFIGQSTAFGEIRSAKLGHRRKLLTYGNRTSTSSPEDEKIHRQNSIYGLSQDGTTEPQRTRRAEHPKRYKYRTRFTTFSVPNSKQRKMCFFHSFFSRRSVVNADFRQPNERTSQEN